jgi:predicted branched-subunit amino acid permease
MHTVQAEIPFTRTGAMAGTKKITPLAVSDFVYGVVFGVLAHQVGLSLLEATLMSGLVVAGAAQFVALGLWAAPLPVLAIALTTFLVNMRYLVMGAALRPWFARLSSLKAYGSVFFLSDESWALTMANFSAFQYPQDGASHREEPASVALDASVPPPSAPLQGQASVSEPDRAFLLGGGLLLTLAWLGGTIIGHLAGAVVQHPAEWGFDFAFVAVFVALLVGMWKGKGDLLPWAVAAVVSSAAARWLPGEWYILLGALAGSLTGVLRHAD